MSLPHVLLGMLARPASGYDLGKAFDESVRHFWYAELSQIYPALAKLEKQGLLKSETQPSEKGPKRKVYRRTPEGERVLCEWLSEGPNYRIERVGYLTQVFFLEAIPHGARIGFMKTLRGDFAARLRELQAIEAHWSNDPRYPDNLPDFDFYAQLTLRSGLIKYQATLDWCDECLERIRAREE